MPTASSLRWALAAVMIATAMYHAGRLVVARLRHRRSELDVDLTHAAMGVAMTIMLVGSVSPGAGRRWAVLFAVPLLWFIWRGLRTYVLGGPGAVGVNVRQAVGCAAMLYMLLAAAPPATSTANIPMAMPGDGASPLLSAVTLLLVAALCGIAVSTSTMLARTRHALTSAGCAGSTTLAPATTACCQVAMNLTAAYMLVVML